MGFSVKQRRALNSELKPSVIRTRQRQGRELSYIEGWHAIAEANRIFGPDGWNRETVETKCLLGRERQGQYDAVYIARVRITVRASDLTVTRDGIGSGEAQGESLGEAHDKAIKTAETDATKRALATFGKPFGLSLYRGKHQPTNPQSKTADLPSPVGRRRTLQRLGANGRFYVEKTPAPVLDPDLEQALQQRLAKPDRPSGSPTTTQIHPDEIQVPTVPTGQEDHVASRPTTLEQITPPPSISDRSEAPDRMAPVAVPSTPREPNSAGAPIAEAPSTMLLPRPARRREPGHLRYVSTQPCLLCGRMLFGLQY